MRVLIAGGRDFTERAELHDFMNQWHKEVTCVISGGARGADRLGEGWARAHDIPTEVYEAQWDKHGRGAGPIRNQQMLDEGKPDMVVVFPGGKGSAHMAKIARKAGVKTVKLEWECKLVRS